MRLIPILSIILITLVVTCVLYFNVMDREEERCNLALKNSAEAVIQEIRMKFADNITVLGLAANAMVEEDKLKPEQADSLHLDTFEENTIFSRIDILYPDNTILLENGTLKQLRGDVDFADIASEGEHISPRMTDVETGHESVYYYMPVIKDGKCRAILTGVVDATLLGDIFQPTIYNGNAICCIIDSTDGNYIMNNWRETLENVYDTPVHTPQKEYESINIKEEVCAQKTGTFAFISATTGENSYMYYAPLGIFNWELLIIARENVVFSSVLYLRKMMILVGALETILLILYFIWDYSTVRQLTKSQEETKNQLEISTTLIQCVTELSSDQDINISIQNLLKIVTQYFDSDRTYIFKYDSEREVLINTFEYVQHGITPQINNLQDVPISVLPHWMEHFRNAEPYYISDLEQERNYDSYEILKAQDIQRLITFPLIKKDGEVLGFVGVDNPQRFYDDATLLSSIQFFITNSLMTKKQEDQLKYMSYRDMLTSLYNRNKYMHFLDENKGRTLENIGASFIDLNGLKQINDQQGHEAGDALICHAAKVISSIFPDDAYRIGGDEFVVIKTGITQAEFTEKIALLQEKMKEEKINSSVGFLWKKSCADLEETLKEADQKMYEEKERYYREHDRRKNTI